MFKHLLFGLAATIMSVSAFASTILVMGAQDGSVASVSGGGIA